MLWYGPGAICLFTAFYAPRRNARIPRGLFAVAAAISAIFMLDDLFLLHERALPVYFDTSEVWLFGLYAILIAGMLMVYHKTILDTDYLLLGMAFGLFAVSLAIDLVFENIRQPYFFEDGSKFAGIVFWTTYHVRNSAAAFRDSATE